MKSTCSIALLGAAALMGVSSHASADALADNYADIALAGYQDSLSTAQTLSEVVEQLIAQPTAESLATAKEAWLEARVPYQQTEVYRFGNAAVDDWEGKVNAWPLDEGLIDYVDASYGTESDENTLYVANVIANATVVVGGSELDASTLSPAFLAEQLHEAGGSEANVATGYHAIEFLLWGQDLNGTEAGAGARSHTDYDTANCSNGNCDRRGQYLKAATALLLTDLEDMVQAWSAGGAARAAVGADEAAVLSTVLTGMGSLSYGELAGERMRLGLMLHDPEEEHDCFSDNTHNSHFYDALGVRNVYTGEYKRVDGKVLSGESLSAKVAAVDAALDAEMIAKLDATMTAMQAMVDRAEGGEAYDQMIAEGNEAGNAVVQAAVDALVAQTKTIERIVVALGTDGLEFEGSDSLDNPEAVFQ